MLSHRTTLESLSVRLCVQLISEKDFPQVCSSYRFGDDDNNIDVSSCMKGAAAAGPFLFSSKEAGQLKRTYLGFSLVTAS